MLGEAWFAEADSVTGPWVYARKIVTHDDYSFYNVRHHPFFDQDGGRRVYFEGTYTATFSGTKVPTPRYDYNQVLYRLDLDDPRLVLPVAVYRWRDAQGRTRWGTMAAVKEAGAWPRGVEAAPFFALPPDRAAEGAVALGEELPKAGAGASALLSIGAGGKAAVFRARAAEGDAREPLAHLWEHVHEASGERAYAVEESLGDGWKRAEKPLCKVWRNPMGFLPLSDAEPEVK
jgi:hypothetical protein